VRLPDSAGKTAGNIDVVLAAYDKKGVVVDFGALEVQAVYISGNVRRPFEHFMEDPDARASMDWSREAHYPRPDYLSSSRKRLAPQLLFKGGILNTWGKKLAVALNQCFFSTLPAIKRVSKAEADIAWLLYDLAPIAAPSGKYQLQKVDVVYTKFGPALASITTPLPGDVRDFMTLLQRKLDQHLETAPTTRDIAERPTDD
jgi:hypothetical protein